MNFLLFSREGNVNCLRSSMNGSWTYMRHYEEQEDGSLATAIWYRLSEYTSEKRPWTHLIVLLDARESCSNLRIAAPVVGVTYNGHHFQFIQRPNDSRQRHSCMLLGQTGRNRNRSASTYSHQVCCGPLHSHLIILWSEHLDDLISHKLMAMNLHSGSRKNIRIARKRFLQQGNKTSSVTYGNYLCVLLECFLDNMHNYTAIISNTMFCLAKPKTAKHFPSCLYFICSWSTLENGTMSLP